MAAKTVYGCRMWTRMTMLALCDGNQLQVALLLAEAVGLHHDTPRLCESFDPPHPTGDLDSPPLDT